MRFLFRLLYREIAWSYDLVSKIVSLGHWREWQRVTMRYTHGPRLLELAFGTGNLLLDWYEAGVTPVGIDLSPQMVRIAARKLRVRGRPLALVQGRAQLLPFANETFDGIVSTFPAEFIWQRSLLPEVERVLRSGGRFVVVMGVFMTGRDLLSRFIEWLYTITGQRSPLPAIEGLIHPDGFSLRWEHVSGDDWLAVVLVGEKV